MTNKRSEISVLFFIIFVLVGCKTNTEMQAGDKTGQGGLAPAQTLFLDSGTGERLVPDAQDRAEHEASIQGQSLDIPGSSADSPKLIPEVSTNPRYDGVVHDPHGVLAEPLVIHQDSTGKRTVMHDTGEAEAPSQK